MRMSKINKLVSIVLMALALISTSGCLIEYATLKASSDFYLINQEGEPVKFEKDKTYELSIIPYSLFGVNFILWAKDVESTSPTQSFLFDLKWVFSIPENGDFSIPHSRIHSQPISIKGTANTIISSHFVQVRERICPDNDKQLQKIKEQVSKGTRYIKGSLYNKKNQPVATYQGQTHHENYETLEEGPCYDNPQLN